MSALVQSLPERIPRYVRNLNGFAERAGFHVTLTVEQSDEKDDPEPRLRSHWRGTRSQLVSLGLLQPHQLRTILTLECAPEVSRYMNVGGGCPWYWERCLLRGPLTASRDAVSWQIDSGPASYTISDNGPIEIVTYEDFVLYHGTGEQLTAFGIDRRRLPLGKRLCKSTDTEWYSRRHPDGHVVHIVESELARRRRLERTRGPSHQQDAPEPLPPRKPSHLRLVVDNDNTRDPRP